MSKILIVAIRDFKVTVLRKAFLLAIVGIPLLMLAILAVAVLIIINKEEPPLIGTIAIVDDSGELLPEAEGEFNPKTIEADRAKQTKETMESLTDPGAAMDPATMQNMAQMGMGRGGVVEVDLEPHTSDDDIAALHDRVKSGDLIALAVIPSDVLETPDPETRRRDRPRFQLTVAQDVDSDHIEFIEDRIGQAVVRVRATRDKQDADQLLAMLRAPPADTQRLNKDGEPRTEGEAQRAARQMIPMAFMLLLFIGTFTAGQQLMMSTIEEKSNRVMEVLLSAISAMQLMTGKILGQVCVGLLLVVVYGGTAIIGLFAAKQGNLISAMDIVYLLIFFFIAFFMVASLMAAVGSAVSDIREANTLFTPVMMLIMIPWMLWMPISQAPNGGVATAFSFIPPASPFVMVLRLAADEPVPAWQIPASIVWGLICVFIMVWACAKIFRIGVLMQGKPPSPLELLKWLRYS